MGKASRNRRARGMEKVAARGEWAKAWELANQAIQLSEFKAMGSVLYHALPQAKVIRVDDGLIQSLPLLTSGQVVRGFREVHLPFEWTFLEFPVAISATASSGGSMVAHSALIGDPHVENKEADHRWVVLRTTERGSSSFELTKITLGSVEGGFYVNREKFGDDQRLEAHEGLMPVLSALQVLESINVEVVEREPPLIPREFHGQIPHFFVDIRTNGKRYVYPDHETKGGTFSHRWEVRGHFKHFTKGRVFEKALEERPEKVLRSPGQPPCVRVWCPPFIAGPADKPLLPKIRTLVA